MKIEDVRSPIDLKNVDDAREWERSAMDRPYRVEYFDKFLAELQQIDKPDLSILELGSGPGFLANHLLDAMPDIKLTLLDFSAAMHELARKRLERQLDRITFIERDFKQAGWHKNLGVFDAVITNQAVHELRHKAYANALHEQVKALLKPGGCYLVCDHYYEDSTPNNDQLFTSLPEGREALELAGYSVTDTLVKGGRVLYRAT